ncbi:MAG TPA: carboxypeptidase-like regulatory domain-containing protein, partial [Fibrobacteria bacterium]|nr:carboxypeptidase-like regulatory domain-containing protein [Fibrobacteria bacterium]
MKRPGLFAIAFALASCGLDRQQGGSTSETSNGLMVQVVSQDGKPAARTLVRIRPADYLADDWTRQDPSQGILDTITNDSGMVRVARPSGELAIEVVSAGARTRIHLDSESSLARCQLQPASRLSGSVHLEPQDERARIQVRGLERSVWTDSAGRFQLDSLPAGRLEVRASISRRGTSAQFLSALHPGESDSLGGIQTSPERPRWTDSVAVWMDTRTISGLTGPVDSVSVLLRLEDSLFPVGARTRGQDLRVVDSAGKAVPFFVEAFSREGRFALVRALVPRVHPSRLAVVLRVRWGDPLAESVSSPSGVFPGARGWAGAWSLDRQYVDAAGRLRAADASTWRDDAVLTGSLAADPEGGVKFSRLGMSGFAASGDWVDLDHSFTVLWRLKPQDKGQVFLGWGDSTWRACKKDFFLQVPKSLSRQAGWNPAFTARADTDFNVYSVSEKSVESGRWVVLSAVRDLAAGDSAVQWYHEGAPSGQTTTSRFTYQGDLPRDSLVVGWRH